MFSIEQSEDISTPNHNFATLSPPPCALIFSAQFRVSSLQSLTESIAELQRWARSFLTCFWLFISPAGAHRCRNHPTCAVRPGTIRPTGRGGAIPVQGMESRFLFLCFGFQRKSFQKEMYHNQN